MRPPRGSVAALAAIALLTMACAHSPGAPVDRAGQTRIDIDNTRFEDARVEIYCDARQINIQVRGNTSVRRFHKLFPCWTLYARASYHGTRQWTGERLWVYSPRESAQHPYSRLDLRLPKQDIVYLAIYPDVK